MACGRAASLLAAVAWATTCACAAADGGGDIAQVAQCEGDSEGTCYAPDEESALLQHRARASSGDQSDRAANRYIYIMRHAERKDGKSCLNECGWDRAGRYAATFGKWLNGQSHRPEIYSFDYKHYADVKQSCQRTSQTASWVAHHFYSKTTKDWDKHIHYITCDKKHLLEVNLTKDSSDGQDHKLAQHIRGRIEDPKQSVSSILVFWEHTNIPPVLQELCGGNDANCKNQQWPKERNEASYDAYFKITYSQQCPGKKKTDKFYHCKDGKDKPHWGKFGFTDDILDAHGRRRRHPASFNGEKCDMCDSASHRRRRSGCSWKPNSPQATGHLLGHQCPPK